jgi:hypothetical protein
LHVHIASYNNFPTAAGLASSAAGFACLGNTLCIEFCFLKKTLFHLIVMSMVTNWISLVVAGQYLCSLLMASVFSVLQFMPLGS